MFRRLLPALGVLLMVATALPGGPAASADAQGCAGLYPAITAPQLAPATVRLLASEPATVDRCVAQWGGSVSRYPKTSTAKVAVAPPSARTSLPLLTCTDDMMFHYIVDGIFLDFRTIYYFTNEQSTHSLHCSNEFGPVDQFDASGEAIWSDAAFPDYWTFACETFAYDCFGDSTYTYVGVLPNTTTWFEFAYSVTENAVWSGSGSHTLTP